MTRWGLIVGAWVVAALACVLVLTGYDRLNYADVVPAWAYFAAVVGPCLAVGAAMQRIECVVVPGLFATAFAVGDGSYLAWVAWILIFVLLGLATGFGWVAGRIVPRAIVPLAAVGLAVSVIGLIPLLTTEVSYATAPELPREAADQLPEDGNGSGVCDGLTGGAKEDALRRVRALIRELKSRPDHVVRIAYVAGESDIRDVEIKVRDLARDELDYLEENHCREDLQAELREEID